MLFKTPVCFILFYFLENAVLSGYCKLENTTLKGLIIYIILLVLFETNCNSVILNLFDDSRSHNSNILIFKKVFCFTWKILIFRFHQLLVSKKCTFFMHF